MGQKSIAQSTVTGADALDTRLAVIATVSDLAQDPAARTRGAACKVDGRLVGAARTARRRHSRRPFAATKRDLHGH